MSSRGSYDTDIAVSVVCRVAIFVSIVAIAIMISGCQRSGTLGMLLCISADNQQIYAGGATDQTRNQLPQRGCDEKSDSSLKQPAG